MDMSYYSIWLLDVQPTVDICIFFLRLMPDRAEVDVKYLDWIAKSSVGGRHGGENVERSRGIWKALEIIASGLFEEASILNFL